MNNVEDVYEETFYDDGSVYNGLESHVHKTGPTTCFFKTFEINFY